MLRSNAHLAFQQRWKGQGLTIPDMGMFGQLRMSPFLP